MRIKRGIWLTIATGALLSWSVFSHAADEPLEFNRDVRPILSDHCFQCHGPDAKNRAADLRLDTEEGALALREGKPAVVRGKLAESELWRRITAADKGERMPPADAPRQLSPQQIDTLRLWIEAGAGWQAHWSFIPPERPAIPAVSQPGWLRGPLDALVLARLDREKLLPAPEADRTALLRRATLDLTGLPPSPGEVAAFLTDQSPDAYERTVDRLLASPRHGERMAVRWLDAARYADTSGYQSDGERIMWRWRDWVIDAFNADMPFDQFTIEQLAGDLLPSPTLDQRLATGFNRNHRGNAEGGIIPEEYAVEYVVDRVETTSAVWLGLTLGCVRCHDHKFDPFTQKDFYQFYAFFNNVPETGRAIKIGNSDPYITTPTRFQAEELTRLQRGAAAATARWERLSEGIPPQTMPELIAAQIAWERQFKPQPGLDWQPTDGLVAAVALEGDAVDTVSANAGTFTGGQPFFAKGQVGQAAQFDGKTSLEVGDVAKFGFFDKFTLSAWIFLPDADSGGTIVSRMADAPQGAGYQLAIVGGKLQLNLSQRWLDDALRVETTKPLSTGEWHHVLASYDGSRIARGVRLVVDGEDQPQRVLLDELNQTFASKEPLRIGGGGGPAMRFRGQIDEVRVYASELTDELQTALPTAASIAQILAQPGRRTDEQKAKLLSYFIREHAPPHIRAVQADRQQALRDLEKFQASLPTTMIMEELPEPRPAHILLRGQYDQPGEKVEREVLTKLAPMLKDAPRNRLGMAKWLVDPANPLPARVTVNRFWQMLFGVGLVKTAEDFGSQGEWPVQPELLDYLATEFSGAPTPTRRASEGDTQARRASEGTSWDTKRLLRQIITSSTYRQSSKVTPALWQRDPENRLLARGPRVRLSAEMVRDGALAASGLLVEQTGGPSVKPYQPAGLWKELTGGDDYQPGRGADLYRRSLYTFWKRTIPPPSMATFDAASREFCSLRESRTNTPLQALVLLNDETYVEAARLLAWRVLREAVQPDERLALAFLLVTGRQPSPQELSILRNSLDKHRARYASAPAEAAKLLAVGQSPTPVDLPPVELAAYATVCSTILNLDEAVTKE
ncbi:MAG: DUF1553 domain-containing protein [Pirellulaceae bacterium]|nr:DUF1553 domain-containing protein [Pirellulaceae bacterium]